MKRIINICALLFVLISFSSCEGDLKEMNKGETPLALTVTNVQQLVEADASYTGITLNWTSGTNKGTDAAISYKIEIAKAGTSFANAYTLDLGQQVYSLSYTEKQLNQILLNDLSATVNASAKYEARITATVADKNVSAQADTVTFDATPYKASSVAPYSMIYFVGSFTSWNFEEMTRDPVNPCIFRYGAVLNWNNGGEFKFGTTSGSWSDMYHPTVADAPYTSTGVQQNDAGDNKWELTQDQCGKAYKMYLDITPGSESFHMSVFTPYPNMYLVGDATPSGWDLSNPAAMTAQDAYTFVWTGNLNTGEIKFSCDKQSDWNGAWFMASENDKVWAAGTEVMTFVDKSISGNGDIDRKWKVTSAGKYTITLNQLTEKLTIQKD